MTNNVLSGTLNLTQAVTVQVMLLVVVTFSFVNISQVIG